MCFHKIFERRSSRRGQPTEQTSSAHRQSSTDIYSTGYFLRRLASAKTAKPKTSPAMIDSHENPGIGVIANGEEPVDVCVA